MAKNQQQLIQSMTDRELLIHLYTTQAFLCLIALVLGLFQYDSFSQFASYFKLDFVSILVYGGGTGLAVVCIDLLLMKVLPSHWYDDGGINERIFANRSILHLFIICLIVSFSEEILFRGVLQVHLGLIWASLIFALVHIRYLKKWFLFLSVVVLSFFIGMVFWWTNNLWVTIVAHFLIDFLLGLQIRKVKEKKKKNRPI
ncbi:CPBP family intramembrane metalloprotease [Priestia megaterium]|nr:CPBP family intramembrane metalloprotease [Priestia megaterium]